MSKIKNMKLRYKIGLGVATAGALATAGGVAFAYWTTTGAGGGNGTVASSNGTLTLSATFPNTLTPGGSVPVTITAANGGSSNLFVSNVIDGTTPISIDDASVQAGCQLSDFSLQASPTQSDATNANGTEVPANTSGVTVAKDTLSMKNTDVSQDGCKGATITLSYASS